VTELERRLLALEIAVPEEPDVAPAVLARIEGRPFRWRRVVLACALLAVALGAAFAVPQARSAILRFFHLGGATVERVQTLPPAVERSGFGRPTSLAGAQRAVGLPLVLPPLDRKPARAYVLDDAVATVVLQAGGQDVLLSEFRATDEAYLKKFVGASTIVEPVRVRGELGLWIEGAPHTLTYLDPSGRFRERAILIRGNVLLWLHGPLTLRLEGKLTRGQAVELARSVR
jgi:hypothetical protein